MKRNERRYSSSKKHPSQPYGISHTPRMTAADRTDISAFRRSYRGLTPTFQELCTHSASSSLFVSPVLSNFSINLSWWLCVCVKLGRIGLSTSLPSLSTCITSLVKSMESWRLYANLPHAAQEAKIASSGSYGLGLPTLRHVTLTALSHFNLGSEPSQRQNWRRTPSEDHGNLILRTSQSSHVF